MTRSPAASVALQPPIPASPKHAGAPHEPGTGGAGGGAGAGVGVAPASDAGAELGGGVVEGTASVLFVPFEDAGVRVGAGVCER